MRQRHSTAGGLADIRNDKEVRKVMKTRLLKRLRREARKEFPVLMLAECKGYFVALKFANEAMRNYILRRVAELKGKRK